MNNNLPTTMLSTTMFSNAMILTNFETNFDLLEEEKNDMLHVYNSIKELILISRNKGILLIGNPLIKSQNRLIELNYWLKLHLMNCKIYKELIDDQVQLDHLFIQQLQGLLEITDEISTNYEILKNQLSDIPMYSKRCQLLLA